MIRKYALLTITLFIAGMVMFGQTAPNKYWIQFTDKNNSNYSITQPSQFLSAKAIQRRANQSIAIVENDLPVNQAYIASIEALGATVLHRSKWLNAVTIEIPALPILNQVLALPFVAGYQKVARLGAQHIDEIDLSNNASRYNKATPLMATDYGAGTVQIEMLNAHILHNQGFRGEGMVIAVLDAGFQSVDTISAFDSLWINNRILGTWDFVDNDSMVFGHHTHGLKVLSTMASNLPGQFVGTAPNASYWLLRTENGATEYVTEEDNWIAGAEFADSVGADVLNTSLGYTVFDDPVQNHSYKDLDGNTTRITKGSDIAASKGMLVVNSAGNNGSSSWLYVSAPADGFDVLAIGAVDLNGSYAPFSAIGPTFDGRTKPNVCAMGYGSTIISSIGTVSYGSGTSFASPILAGAAACLWQANPTFSSSELFQAIEESGSIYLSPDNYLGHGIPDHAAASIILDNKLSERESFFKVCPNPFEDNITIQFYLADTPKVSFELMDIQGRVFAQETVEDTHLSMNYVNFDGLGSLSSGIYLIRVTSDRFVHQLKLIRR